MFLFFVFEFLCNCFKRVAIRAGDNSSYGIDFDFLLVRGRLDFDITNCVWLVVNLKSDITCNTIC